jgi:hypothetical protein
MKKTAICGILIIAFLYISGCAKSSYKITAASDIEVYSAYMSSVRGLPITFEITGDDYDHFEVYCEEGEVFAREGRIGAGTEHGDRLSFDKRDTGIYWSPGESTQEDVTLEITLFKDNKEVYKKKYTIKYIDDMSFSFKGDE